MVVVGVSWVGGWLLVEHLEERSFNQELSGWGWEWALEITSSVFHLSAPNLLDKHCVCVCVCVCVCACVFRVVYVCVMSDL